MTNILSELEAFEILLGGAPGGNAHALRWWESIGEMADDLPKHAILDCTIFDRKGWIALAIYGLKTDQPALTGTAIYNGAELERMWLNKHLTSQSGFDTVES